MGNRVGGGVTAPFFFMCVIQTERIKCRTSGKLVVGIDRIVDYRGLGKMAKLIGYRVDMDGNRLLMYRESRKVFYVEYKGEHVKVEPLYEMVKDGTYNQSVQSIPYIVLDNDVYPVNTFTEVGGDR